jgi:hypothetical protein
MKWKEKEEEAEEQKEERMEKINEIEEKLLAMEPFNDHIVVYEEKIIDTDEDQEKKEDIDNQEEKEEIKEKQETQKEHTREKGEKNAELMIEQVEEQREDHKEKINENKAIEEVKEDHRKEQVEKQPEMSLEEKKNKLETIEEVLLKVENYTDQKVKWEDETQRERVLGVNTKKGEEEEKTRQSIVETGQQAIKTRKHSDRTILTHKWNKYVEKGGRITTDMWEVYNKIQEKFRKPIVLYKEDNEVNRYKMSLCGELFSKIESYNISHKRFSKLLDYWLIQTNVKRGNEPFFEVQCRNPSNGELNTYWIPNIKPKAWNPYKGKEREFFYRETGALMKNVATTRINLKEEDIKLYNALEVNLRKKYPRIKTQTHKNQHTVLGNQLVLFKTIYRLNYERSVIDESIKLAFWKNANSQAKNDAFGFIKRINITQMRKGTSTLSNSKKIARGIYTLSGDGSVKFQNWTDELALSIKKADPNFIMYEKKDGVINGVSAPPLINTIKKYLIYEDKSTIKSGLRMINNLLTIAGHESLLKRGKCNWKRLFPKDIDLNKHGIPKSYQSIFIYLEKLNTGGSGAKWINTFRDEFLIPISDWLSVSGLEGYTKALYIRNPNTQKKYKTRFNYFSALLKFQAGLGDWIEDRWQGSYSKLYVLKYSPEHIFASLKYICEVTQLSGINRTGKNKEKIIRFFQETDKLKIINPVPVSKNFKFIVTTSSRNQSLSYFSKKYFKNKPIGSKIVQTHLVSVLNNCNLTDIDPWTVQGAINRKVIKKIPKNLREFLVEEGDGPINSFCTSIFLDSDFRKSCEKTLNFDLISKIGEYPKNGSKYVITQSIKSSKLADTYGKSFTAANIPDAVANYKKDVGSKELLFIKVVENNLLHSVESDISEILKTNNDKMDPFQVFSAYVFTYSDVQSLPIKYKKYNKLLLQLEKHDADGIINFEIPDLQTMNLMRFGEIWASCKIEVVHKRSYKSSRNKYLKDPEDYKDRMISKIMKKINTFQKLNPVDRETVQKGFELVAFGAETRTEFVQDTLQNYLEHIKTHSIIDPSQKI